MALGSRKGIIGRVMKQTKMLRSTASLMSQRKAGTKTSPYVRRVKVLASRNLHREAYLCKALSMWSDRLY